MACHLVLGALALVLCAMALQTPPQAAETLMIGGTGSANVVARKLAEAYRQTRPGLVVVVLLSLGMSGGLRAGARRWQRRSSGRLVVSVGTCRGRPCLRQRIELRDAGLPVGALEVDMELRPLLAHTATIGGVASLLGLVAVGLFCWFP